ncbi:MAG: hypothetical protein OSB00_19395 [Sphingomonas bacterium]|nr:hypothetical protein [Sphingomonas bacterium]
MPLSIGGIVEDSTRVTTGGTGREVVAGGAGFSADDGGRIWIGLLSTCASAAPTAIAAAGQQAIMAVVVTSVDTRRLKRVEPRCDEVKPYMRNIP